MGNYFLDKQTNLDGNGFNTALASNETHEISNLLLEISKRPNLSKRYVSCSTINKRLISYFKKEMTNEEGTLKRGIQIFISRLLFELDPIQNI